MAAANQVARGSEFVPLVDALAQQRLYAASDGPVHAGAAILAGCEPATQFGRAMGELEIKVIVANSPQAKRSRN